MFTAQAGQVSATIARSLGCRIVLALAKRLDIPVNDSVLLRRVVRAYATVRHTYTVSFIFSTMYDERTHDPTILPVQLQHPLDQLDHLVVPRLDIAHEYGKILMKSLPRFEGILRAYP
jgi:hypothetical protein